MKYVDTLFCPSLICVPNPGNFKKKIFSHQGTVRTSRSWWFNPFRHRSTQSVISCQNDQNALGQPRVDRRSKLVKTSPK